MKTTKIINAICFFIIIVLAFFPIVTIEFLGGMNVIDFIIGPSELREMGMDPSELINIENSLLLILPAIGLICSIISVSNEKSLISPIICLVVSIIGNMIISKLGENISDYSFAIESSIGLISMSICYKASIVVSIISALLAFNKKIDTSGKTNGKKTNIPNNVSEKVKCLNCGSENDKNSAFCINCGAKIGKLICKNCGSECEQGEEFCSICGKRINEQASENE